MLSINDIKTGKKILLGGEPFAVISHEHSKMGRAGAVLRTKLKNLKTGAVQEKTFQGSEKVDEAHILKSQAQYLYNEEDAYYFMDMESYEQFFLNKNVLGEATQYLIEETIVDIISLDSTPLNIELPIKVELRVVDAPPGVKGDTVTSGSKLVTLETGAELSVPLFVKTDDSIIVNTESGEYVSRAS